MFFDPHATAMTATMISLVKAALYPDAKGLEHRKQQQQK
jgi:hypothetical protein